MKEKIAQIIYNKKYESKTYEDCLEISELILEILEVVQPERLSEEDTKRSKKGPFKTF